MEEKNHFLLHTDVFSAIKGHFEKYVMKQVISSIDAQKLQPTILPC